MATWSLRLRPVWSFLPKGPTFSMSRDSTHEWMSSASLLAGSVGSASTSAASPASAASSEASSSAEITPARRMALAQPTEPAMSWRARR